MAHAMAEGMHAMVAGEHALVAGLTGGGAGTEGAEAASVTKYINPLTGEEEPTTPAPTPEPEPEPEPRSPGDGEVDGWETEPGIYLDKPDILELYPNRSWAIVTFVNQAAVQVAADTDPGTWEGGWDAETFRTAAAWNLGDMKGRIGSLRTEGKATKAKYASDAINRHNENLHAALDAALNLKKKVEQARKGLFDDSESEEENEELDAATTAAQLSVRSPLSVFSFCSVCA